MIGSQPYGSCRAGWEGRLIFEQRPGIRASAANALVDRKGLIAGAEKRRATQSRPFQETVSRL